MFFRYPYRENPLTIHRTFVGFLLLLVLSEAGASQPVEELRAAWITTAASLDWPRSRKPQEQQEELLGMIAALARGGFNTIFFQVRARGDAYYRSTLEPWAGNLTGSPGSSPGWDPLAFVIDHAHAAGLEVHAWINLYKVSGQGFPEPSTPRHIARAKPEWVYTYDGELWLNAGTPGVNEYLLKVAMEVVRNYDIDGVQFDFARYPGKNIPDQADYSASGRGTPLAEWRRNNVDLFFRMFSRAASAVKPWMKIGATPVGNIVENDSGPVPTAYDELYQDAPSWIREGTVDYIAPQIYWSLGATPSDPDFAVLARRWVSASGDRHVYAGLAPYKPEVLEELAAQIDSSRAAGCRGQAFFRYSNIDFRKLRNRYAQPAAVPSMLWKKTSPPDSPSQLAVTETPDRSVLLEWSRPADTTRSEEHLRYRIYRSAGPGSGLTGPGDLIGTTGYAVRHFVDSTGRLAAGPAYYTVVPEDRFGQTGTPSPTISSFPHELIAMRELLTSPVAMSATVDSSDSGILIAYQLPAPMAVTIMVQQDARQTTNPLLETVVGGVHGEGVHLLKVNGRRFPGGDYYVVLKAGGVTINRSLTIP